MRRETDHPHTLRELRDGTFQRVCHFHQLGLRLAVVCRLFLAFAAANLASDDAMPFVQERSYRPYFSSVQRHSRWRLTSRKFCPRQSSCRLRLHLHFADFQTLFEVVGLW